MYVASEDFHSAVYSANPLSRIWVSMPEISLDASDLIASELTFSESINNDEDLTIGSCPAAAIDFKIRNNHGLLSDYPFTGECDVRLAVRIKAEDHDPIEMPYAVFRYGGENETIFQGHLTEPYFTVNGSPTTEQPPFPVGAILIDEDRVWCVSLDGGLWGVKWNDGQSWNDLADSKWNDMSTTQWDGIQGVPTLIDVPEVHSFMRMKLSKWAKQGRGIWHSGKLTHEFNSTQSSTYEYVPLGKFIPDKPEKRRVSQIDFSATDRMVLFDAPATEFLNGLSYPISLGEIFERMCAHIGIPRATTTFTNSAHLVELAPFDANEYETTYREVLMYIAEVACSFGRITRDGEVELAWFGEKSVNIPMTQYFDIDIAEYSVPKIEKLQIFTVGLPDSLIIGSGENTYQIIDNPYINSREMCVPIYTKLSAFNAYQPIEARAVCDWSIQAGDVISITLNGTTYSLPVYRQTITWNGGACRVVYESTGSAARPIPDSVTRKSFGDKQTIHRIERDLEGAIAEFRVATDNITARVEDVEEGQGYLEITTEDILLRVEDTENNMASLELATNEISLEVKGVVENVDGLSGQLDDKVSYDKVISSINLTPEDVTIDAGKINLNGVVTANETFKINEDGSMEATGGTIGGWTISENSLGAYGSSISVQTDALTGEKYGQINATAISGTNVSADKLYANALEVLKAIKSPLFVTSGTIKRNENSNEYYIAGYESSTFISEQIVSTSGLYANDIYAPLGKTELNLNASTIYINKSDTNLNSVIGPNTLFSGWSFASPYMNVDTIGAYTVGGNIAISSPVYITNDGDPSSAIGYSLVATGNIMCYGLVQTSDARLKENIADISDADAAQLILSLRPVSYTFKDGGAQERMGFIAQEAPEVLRRECLDGYWGLDYTAVIAPLVKTVQHIMEVIGIEREVD